MTRKKKISKQLLYSLQYYNGFYYITYLRSSRLPKQYHPRSLVALSNLYEGLYKSYVLKPSCMFSFDHFTQYFLEFCLLCIKNSVQMIPTLCAVLYSLWTSEKDIEKMRNSCFSFLSMKLKIGIW